MGPCPVGQQGILGKIGLNNIGLFVKTWGNVTGVDQSPTPLYFSMTDGYDVLQVDLATGDGAGGRRLRQRDRHQFLPPERRLFALEDQAAERGRYCELQAAPSHPGEIVIAEQAGLSQDRPACCFPSQGNGSPSVEVGCRKDDLRSPRMPMFRPAQALERFSFLFSQDGGYLRIPIWGHIPLSRPARRIIEHPDFVACRGFGSSASFTTSSRVPRTRASSIRSARTISPC